MRLFNKFAPKADVVAAKADGKPFLFPNDFCFGPDGAIYLTNTGITVDAFSPNNQILPDNMDVQYGGRLYRNDPDTGVVEKTDQGIRLTNGIAVHADELICLSETLTGNIYRYRRDDGKVSSPCELFGNVIQADATPGREGPGLMVSDQNGPSHVAAFGRGDVTVLERKKRL
jgi:gluconolactonase